MNIKILVATHKEYWMPQNDIYLPIQLGKAINNSLTYCGDNTGENISEKQPYYSELTAIYWAWKNLRTDYIGINHYRRYFSKEKYCIWGNGDKEKIFNYNDFSAILKKHPVLLPKKRNYFIESRYEQYKNAHNIEDLLACKKVISELYPDYIKAFDIVMNKSKGHILNMFVMRYDIFCAYCDWLFKILFTLEKRINIDGYTEYQRRVFGYLAERLLDVWLMKNKIEYAEADYVVLEKVDWLKKIKFFLHRKFIWER